MHGAGIGVVCGLGHVDVVVGMAVLVLASLVSHDLQGTVGYHLVGVHVHAGAGSALHHVDGEELQMLAVYELLAGFHYGVAHLVGYEAKLVVCLDGRHFHDTEGLDELRVVAQMIITDIEVLNAPQCLDAEESLLGHFFVSEQVMLCPGLAGYGKFKLYHFKIF